MPSIVLSFVGEQDPVSLKTKKEGSIISLVRELQSKKIPIKKLLLFYTQGTKINAEKTPIWLNSDDQLKTIPVELIACSQELSDDPLNFEKAAQEVKRGLELVKKDLNYDDHIDFNASSGTPAMKSALSILQAAGYAGSRSSVWQVRNPKQKKKWQEHVFETNVSSLRQEFDLKVLKQFIKKYNYSAALNLLRSSELNIAPQLKAKIDAGYHWHQGQFKDFFEETEHLWTAKQKQHADAWWSKSYEQAFTAFVRFSQGNTTEAMLLSFRAVEGSLYEWVEEKYSNHLEIPEDAYPLVHDSIFKVLPELETNYKKEKQRNRKNKVYFQGWFQQDFLGAAIPVSKTSEDFKVYWTTARDGRNCNSHRLGGMNRQQLFAAWQVDSYVAWEKRLLNCLKILTDQSFESLEEASLFASMHQDIQRELEHHQI